VSRKPYYLLLAGSTAWCLGVIAAPLLGSPVLYDFFSMICHQDSARTLHVPGGPLAVCIRCSAIYLGFAASLWAGLQTNVRWLRIAIVMMVAEFALARLFFDAAALRALSGVLVGVLAAPFVRRAVEEISESM
jgi:uncharacterized membrane protein